MSFDVIIAIVLCAAVAFALVVTAANGSLRVNSTRRWINKRYAPITPALGAAIERRLAQRLLASGIGSLIGLVAAIFLVLAVGRDIPTLAVWAVIILTIVGWSVGEGVPALRAAVRPVLGTIRVAHSSAAQIGDFINPIAVRLLRGVIVLVSLAALVSALLPFWRGPGFGTGESGAVWVVLALLLLSWAAAEFAVRRLIAQPQASAHPVELIWDDAIRSQQVYDLYCLPGSLAIGTGALATIPIEAAMLAPDWTVPFMVGISLVGQIAILTGLIMICLCNGVVQSRRRTAAITAAQAA